MAEIWAMVMDAGPTQQTTMPGTPAALFSNIGRSDPLEFRGCRGLDYKRIAGFLDLDAGELSRLSGVSRKSVRLDARIPQNLKTRLDEIANICTLVAEYFEGDAERTALWFTTKNPMLGETSPRDMIRAGRAGKLLKFIMEARNANSGSGR